MPPLPQWYAVGLVFLPGAMTGLILAGADPVDAVLVQAAIMYLILGCVATNVVIIGLGLSRRLFTPDHRLVRLARSGGSARATRASERAAAPTRARVTPASRTLGACSSPNTAIAATPARIPMRWPTMAL